MNLVRAAFLVWLASLSASPLMAIEICSGVSAEGGVAACGDIQARDIIVGLKPIEVQELMRELFAQESAAIHKIEELIAGYLILNAMIGAMLTARAGLHSEFMRLHRGVLAIARAHRVCRRLMAVPAVGAVVVATFKVMVDDPAWRP